MLSQEPETKCFCRKTSFVTNSNRLTPPTRIFMLVMHIIRIAFFARNFRSSLADRTRKRFLIILKTLALSRSFIFDVTIFYINDLRAHTSPPERLKCKRNAAIKLADFLRTAMAEGCVQEWSNSLELHHLLNFRLEHG